MSQENESILLDKVTPEFQEWWDAHKNNPVTIQCSKCKKEIPEEKIQLSHDVPKYAGGTDKDGRHFLCEKCHDIYEGEEAK